MDEVYSVITVSLFYPAFFSFCFPSFVAERRLKLVQRVGLINGPFGVTLFIGPTKVAGPITREGYFSLMLLLLFGIPSGLL